MVVGERVAGRREWQEREEKRSKPKGSYLKRRERGVRDGGRDRIRETYRICPLSWAKRYWGQGPSRAMDKKH